MSLEENKAVVRRLFEEVLNDWNLDVVDEIFGDQFREDSLPAGQTLDREDIKHIIAELRIAFPDLRTTIEDMLADGDKVVVRLTFHGTHQGMFGTFPPTGKRATWTAISIFHLANAKIVYEWNEENRVIRARQLGMLPPSTPLL